MASAATILAVVRAAAPSCRSPQDALSFAVHAAVCACGYRLVGVGQRASLEGLSLDAPDVPVDGWNSDSDSSTPGASEAYAFAYLSEEPVEAAAAGSNAAVLKLLLRVVPVGDVLLASLATDAPSAQPQTVELRLSNFIVSSEAGAAAKAAAAAGATQQQQPAAKVLKNLGALASIVSGALAALTAASSSPAAGTSGSAAKKQCADGQASRQQQQQQEGPGRVPQPQRPQQQPPAERDPDYDPLRIGPPRRPMRIGEDDVMPLFGGGGMGGGGSGIGGGMLPGGPPLMGGGGGMHVGPDHPFFSDRMRHPDVMPGRPGPGGPGGIRWDPINPEGLQGWRPEDFQRQGPGQQGGFGGRGGRGGGGPGLGQDLHPDLEQPGGGRGGRGLDDFDSMYG